MALVTIQNKTLGKVSLPPPISRTLNASELITVAISVAFLEQFTNIKQSSKLGAMISKGLVTVSVQEDPATPDSLELLPASAMVPVGGYKSVADTTERNSIDATLRQEGMLVRTNADNRFWLLDADLTTWTLLTGFDASGGEVQIEGSVAVSGTGSDVATITLPDLPANGYWFMTPVSSLAKLVTCGTADSSSITLTSGGTPVVQWSLDNTDTDDTYKVADTVSPSGIAGGTALKVQVVTFATGATGPLSIKMNFIPLVQRNELFTVP